MLKQGEEQGISWEGLLGVPASARMYSNTCPAVHGQSRFTLFSMPVLLSMGLLHCLHWVLVTLSLLGYVCPHGSACCQVGAHMCKCCWAAQRGGDGANSFLRLTRNRLMAEALITVILASIMVTTS